MLVLAFLASLLAAVFNQAALAQSLPPPERMLTQPRNCSGWPEPRFWIEAQQWWTDAGLNVSSDSRHFHLGACMPYNQTLSGFVVFDILAQLHYNPDYLMREIYFLAPLPSNSTGIVTDTTNHRIGSTGIIDWSCPEANVTCMRVFRITVDTRLVPQDCVAPLRLRADTALLPGIVPDLSLGRGYQQVPELSFMAQVRYSNGKPACPTRVAPDFLPEIPTIGAGFNDFPWSYSRMTVFKDALPTSPLSGNWTIRQLMSFDQRIYNRVRPVVAPVTRSFVHHLLRRGCMVTVDPRFHILDPATNMRIPSLGSIQLDVNDMVYQNLVIDTTKLTDGVHVFFFRTDSFIEPGTTFPDIIPWLPGVRHTFSDGKPHPGGTASAVLSFAFTVNNTQLAARPAKMG
ncbi:hypothetical protein VOLCADRAFT_104270 [Volvox carteri f. nagariensis]|uniref:Uncharacterized protein n=1 Tax=Volvox carteri f. nagariensis TaxID=3068 RepID=D8TRS2_VOLCA|nr:uncharacterized protein VOLCADRAFT_104270 [Volvox carteri f. nagariensis]EFJ49819.1 hypothetical protein VOLCADRAFT_104270 [Volvox carteri f. nagariensis]|eukprot:XP_002949326.1 hypothetical protein VOLCADRAFT_104270 [Volvox carteri f. nagariensis]